MIGTVEEAVFIAQWELEMDEHCEWLCPEGWEVLGEGAYRVAFRSPSGVVYKRENEDGKYYGHNCREWENIQRLKRIPVQGWRVPESTLYSVKVSGPEVSIIAMEYVSGESDVHCYTVWGDKHPCTCGSPSGRCTAEVWLDMREAWGIGDVHTGNIRVEEDGTRVLIDCADDDEYY
jgi:hypothetical protein